MGLCLCIMVKGRNWRVPTYLRTLMTDDSHLCQCTMTDLTSEPRKVCLLFVMPSGFEVLCIFIVTSCLYSSASDTGPDWVNKGGGGGGSVTLPGELLNC